MMRKRPLATNSYGAVPPPTAEEALEKLAPLADMAVDAFSHARRLSPINEHGYVTHVQVILSLTEGLRKLSQKPNFHELCDDPGHVGMWLRKNLAIAEDLLSTLQHIQGESEPSRHTLRCVSKLTSLYGNFERVIERWESLLMNAADPTHLRRALASAYHARGKRSWAQLSPEELRRIRELTEDNLKVDPTNARDLRMWFQAYRRLPEFNYIQALDRLQTWEAREGSLEANYYLYILHFLRWLDRREVGEVRVLDHLERCRNLAFGGRTLIAGKRTVSYEWLGRDPSWCPLVHHQDLGKWNRDKNFYDEVRLLQPVSGTIRHIKGQQAGWIKIGDKIQAFFVPGTDFWASQDIGARVHFFLGFSYDGLRAWDVSRMPRNEIVPEEPAAAAALQPVLTVRYARAGDGGSAPKQGSPPRETLVPKGEAPPPETTSPTEASKPLREAAAPSDATPKPVALPPGAASSATAAPADGSLAGLHEQPVITLTAAEELIRRIIAGSATARVSLGDLVAGLEAHFGTSKPWSILGYESCREMIGAIPKLHVFWHNGKSFVEVVSH